MSRKLRNDGYSLIELLVVIIIITIIFLIALPLVVNILNSVRKSAFKSSAYGISKAAYNEFSFAILNNKDIKELTFSYLDKIEYPNPLGYQLKYRGFKPESGTVIVNNNGKVSLALYNGKWCAEKEFDEEIIRINDKNKSECNLTVFLPTIELIGDNPQYVEINTQYIDPGVIATAINGSPINNVEILIKKDNQIVTSVDTTFLNDYEIFYIVVDEYKVAEVIRKVLIIDTIPPVLTIPNDISLLPSEVKELDLMEGVIATDNSNGDVEIIVSGNVSSIPGQYTIKYVATDSSGNKTTKIRNITVLGLPTIELIGNNPVYVEINTDYNEPGIIAKTSGGEIISDVFIEIRLENVVVEKVETNRLSSYNLTYTVYEDTRATTISRDVIIIDTIPPNLIIPENRTITVEEVNFFNSMEGVLVTDNSQEKIDVQVSGNLSRIPGIYTLTYTAKDSSGNTTKKTRKITVIDNNAPIITIIGDNPLNINVGNPFVDLGAKATDNVDGDLTNNIVVTGTVNINIPGKYEIIYTVVDSSNNIGRAIRTVNVIDNIPPVINFNPSGNTVWSKTASSKLSVNDVHSNVDTKNLKYLWSTSTIEPSESLFSNIFNNGEIIINSSLTGSYYLWILAKDTAGNVSVKRSNVFNIDNTKPVITLIGNSVINIERGSTYLEPGATAYDSHSGVSGNVIISGTVNTNIEGSYTITYNITDNAGNTAVPVTRIVNVIVTDKTPPQVTFTPNGDSVYKTFNSSRVVVSDSQSGVDTNSLRYQWTTSTSVPSESGFTNVFYNGNTIPTPSKVTGNYYLWILAKDKVGNKAIVRSNEFKLDNTNPTISFGTNGNSTYAKTQSTTVTVNDSYSGVNTSSLKYQWTTSTSTPSESSFTTSFSNGYKVNSPTGLTGCYYLWVLAKDNAGNTTISRSNIFNIDNTNPTISFGTNGNSTYAKTQSTSVTVNDPHSGVNTSFLKYQWTTSTSTPSESSFSTSFTNGYSVNSPISLSGSYYLWILAKDKAGNTTISRSNVFNLDNTPPNISGINLSITSLTETSFAISRSANATDVHSGLVSNPYIFQISTNGSSWTTKCTSNSTSCSVYSLNRGINYYYRLCVRDKVNNEICSSSKLAPVLFYTKFTSGKYFLTSATNNYVKIGSNVWRVMYRSGTNVRITTDRPISNYNSSFDPYTNVYSNSALRSFTERWCRNYYSSYASSCDAMTKTEVQCINSYSCSNLSDGVRLSGYLGATVNYWTQTADGTKNVWVVAGSASGTVFQSRPHNFNLPATMRPVMNVKSTIKVIEGTGTSSNPYVIFQ